MPGAYLNTRNPLDPFAFCPFQGCCRAGRRIMIGYGNGCQTLGFGKVDKFCRGEFTVGKCRMNMEVNFCRQWHISLYLTSGKNTP